MSGTHDNIEELMKRFAEALRRAGIKVTHQRLEIYREVATRADHPDIETLFRAIRRRMPTVSLDTVYRTLSLFQDLGLVGTLRPREEKTRFDGNTVPHHHFVCLRCGLTRDVHAPGLDHLEFPDGTGVKGTVRFTHVEFRGLCPACEAAGPDTADEGLHGAERSPDDA